MFIKMFTRISNKNKISLLPSVWRYFPFARRQSAIVNELAFVSKLCFCLCPSQTLRPLVFCWSMLAIMEWVQCQSLINRWSWKDKSQKHSKLLLAFLPILKFTHRYAFQLDKIFVKLVCRRRHWNAYFSVAQCWIEFAFSRPWKLKIDHRSFHLKAKQLFSSNKTWNWKQRYRKWRVKKK